MAGEPTREAQLGATDVLPAPAVAEETVLPPHRGEVILMVLAAVGDGGTAQGLLGGTERLFV